MTVDGLAPVSSIGSSAIARGAAIMTCVLALLHADPAQSQVPDRSKPPAPGPTPELRLPPIQHLKLSNGLPVVLLEKHGVPLVQINLVVRAGSVDDPPGKAGLASLTAAMLTDGAGKRGALELADAIDFLGAHLTSDAGYHTIGVSLHTPVAQLDSALSLMADVVLRPTFPPPELERERKARLTILLQWRDEPRSLATVLFNRTLYGGRHPYGIPTLGDAASIGSIGTENIRQFYESYFHPGDAVLVVVGDVTASSVMPRLESAFGEWPAGKAPSRTLPAIRQVTGRAIFLVDKPGAPQTEIRIGRIGAERLTADFYPLVVMNTILGGSFTSRLNENLRERHGYTYGAYSYFSFRELPGPFVAGAAVQTAVTDKALREFMNELEGILKPIPDADVERAKKYVALSFPGDFQSVAQIAAHLEDLVIYHLPDDYFDTYIDKILSVTTIEVERVAEKYIDPKNMDIIIVGDRKQIAAGIDSLNLGPVKNLSVEDVLGPPPAGTGGR